MDAHIGRSHAVEVTSKRLVNDCNFVVQLIQIIWVSLKVSLKKTVLGLVFHISYYSKICDDVSRK